LFRCISVCTGTVLLDECMIRSNHVLGSRSRK
jgi:hypothetical protein